MNPLMPTVLSLLVAVFILLVLWGYWRREAQLWERRAKGAGWSPDPQAEPHAVSPIGRGPGGTTRFAAEVAETHHPDGRVRGSYDQNPTDPVTGGKLTDEQLKERGFRPHPDADKPGTARYLCEECGQAFAHCKCKGGPQTKDPL